MTDSRDISIERQIDSICIDFKNKWSSGTNADFNLYLERIDGEHQQRLLQRLIEVDLDLRQNEGQAVDADDYRKLGDQAVEFVNALLSSRNKTMDHGNQVATTEPHASTSSAKQIGPYKLLQPIGEGGMGSVWMADQLEPVKRRVALKVIKAGMDSKQVIARFEAERQALAMVDHQNIAKVLDAGMTPDGRPYFAMELVEGISITKYCDQNRLTPNERLELFIQVCNAIQHAHQKGIIHRDIKPSNVLVTLYDGKPVSKVIDFGLAKALQHQVQLTDKTMFTEFGQAVGTWMYMSPEQAERNAMDVDTRTDVYSLGVLLYELLTGSTPLEREAVKEAAWFKIVEMIREREPPSPSTRLSDSGDAITGISEQRKIAPSRLQQILRGELDWVVMKALEKDRTRRYETANGLAADVQRYLDDEPVVARPASTSYRMRKFVRKNKRLVTTAAAFVAVLVGAVAVSAWFAVDASIAKKKAEMKTIEVTKEKDRADKSAKRSEDVLKIVTDSFKSANPDEGSTAKMTAREVLFNARQALRTSDLDFEGKTKLLSTLGISFYGIGEYDSAISVWEEVVTLRTEKLGPDHPDTLRSMNNLAGSYYDAGRSGEALLLREEVVAMMTDQLGANHPNTLMALANLAVSYGVAGRADEALELEKKILSQMTEELGSDHPSTLSAMGNLAFSYDRAGWTREALELGEKVLALSIEKLGSDHPFTLTSMHNLASRYGDAGRTGEALELREKVLAQRTEKLGSDHPDTLRSMNNLAISYIATGRSGEALELKEKVLSLITKKLGPDHPSTFRSMNSVATSYRAAGRTDEAVELEEKALARCTEKLGPDHPLTLRTMSNLALSYGLAGRTDEALELAEKVLALQIENLGPNHSETLGSMNNLALSYNGVGRIDEAMELVKKVVLLMTEKLGPDHPDTLRSMINLALAYREAGRIDQAIELAEKASAKFNEKLGPNHPDTKRSESTLASMRQNAGRTTAEKINGTIWNKVASTPDGADPPITAEELEQMRNVCKQHSRGMYFNTLGVAEYRMGNFEQAIAAAEKSVEKTPGEMNLPSPYPGDLVILAMSHHRLGNADKATNYRKQLAEAMNLDEFKDEAECKSFVAEVNKLFASQLENQE